MTKNQIARSTQVTQFEGEELNLDKDTYVADNQLKFKLRSINLIKHNPNHFRNTGSEFYELMGGNRALITILGSGVVAMLYRMRANSLRKLSTREGIWMNNIYFWFGAALGTFYSAVFFARWQIFFNDYYANTLLNRFPDSKSLTKHNIYALKDVPSEDDCYHFSNSYINSYHI
jgi:hypothetical protein